MRLIVRLLLPGLLWLAGQMPLWACLPKTGGGSTSYDHYDGRGDVTTQTSAAGVVTWQADYEAWGTRTAEFGRNADRQRANTKEEDPTGLLNEGRRIRDLETGVFLTKDPAGFVDGPNLYAYVNQNPWTKFDPEGLSDWAWHWTDQGVLGAVATAITSPLHVGYEIGYGVQAGVRGGAEMLAAFDRGVSARTELAKSDVTPEQFQAFNEQRQQGINEVGHGLAAALPLIPGTSMTGPAALPETAGTGSLESSVVRDSTGSVENGVLKPELAQKSEAGAVYDVGTASDLRKTAVPGTQVHHAPGSAPASTLVGDHNPANNVGNEPAMRLPQSEHEDVTAAQNALPAQASARDLLAREAQILRNNTNAPNNKIQELIQLNKDKHPYDYKKLNQ